MYSILYWNEEQSSIGQYKNEIENEQCSFTSQGD